MSAINSPNYVGTGPCNHQPVGLIIHLDNTFSAVYVDGTKAEGKMEIGGRPNFQQYSEAQK
jgi:hypothetical protein